MLQVGVSIDTKGLEVTLQKILEAFDTTEILDEAGALLLNRIRTRFLAETDPEGHPWEPSKAGIKRRASGGSGTLFKTGRLFRSIQLAGTGPNERAIITDVPYASYHNFGLGGLPQRLFMAFSEDDAKLVERLIEVRARRILG